MTCPHSLVISKLEASRYLSYYDRWSFIFNTVLCKDLQTFWHNHCTPGSLYPWCQSDLGYRIVSSNTLLWRCCCYVSLETSTFGVHHAALLFLFVIICELARLKVSFDVFNFIVAGDTTRLNETFNCGSASISKTTVSLADQIRLGLEYSS